MKRIATTLKSLLPAATALVLPVGQALAQGGTVTVDVDKPGVRVSPMLWGIFFEDINLSTDGGVYPERVRNRNFEDADKPDHWTLLSSGLAKAEMAVDREQPVSARNPRALKVTVRETGTGRVGVANSGFYGMAVEKGARYTLSLYQRAEPGAGALTASLESSDGVVYARAALPKPAAEWRRETVTLAAKDTDPRARLVISTEKPGTFWIDMVSLMPAETWKGHGLRPDLMEMIAGLKPAFNRFPGGCWVEGDRMKEAYRWKQTIGDPAERRTQHNIWGYEATHGVGFHEYLVMCEDLGCEPLFVINCGMSHRENVPMDQMDEFVQDALDAIEYCNGPADSTWGKVRAQAGHPAPFNLKYMEIGNENGGPAYHERWALFHKAIRARYPEIKLIADVWNGYPKNPMPDILDEHYYNSPDFFIAQAGKYDSYDRKGPRIYVGEYAVTSGAGLGNLRGAIGEAAFMTGMERNSDVVVMASYAPLLVNVNHKRWPINLINYDGTGRFGIPSYYVQQLFGQNRGDVVLPIAVQAPLAPSKPRGGGVGVGTWLTQAEFKDLKVTRGDQTLFASDSASGLKGWKTHGGDWHAENGVFAQRADGENIFTTIGDKEWNDYTFSLKARKTGGAEGFLILFRSRGDHGKSWWNIGGWGNSRHALETEGVAHEGVKGRIETGRWYDIRIELRGSNIKCYLDNQLVHDVTTAPVKSLYASATREDKTGEVILKVVNVADDPVEAAFQLNGVQKLRGPAEGHVLTSADPTDENTLEEPLKVAPVRKSVAVDGTTLRDTLPGNSLTVLRVKTAP